MKNTAIEKLSSEAQEVLALIEPFTIECKEDFENAADFARDLKTQIKTIEDERKKIADPQYAAWKATNALFSKISGKFKEAEKILKERMATFLEAERAREVALLQEAATGNMTALALAGEAAPTAPGISARPKVEFRVVDYTKLPIEYLMPNEQKIRAAVNVGVQIPGVEVTVGTSIAITARK